MCANWRHVRASADDYWWLWIIIPLWYDGPHIQGEFNFLCHHLVHLFDLFQDNMPQKECEDLVLQAVTQVNLLYILRPQTIEFPYAEISWLIHQ